MQIYTFTTGSSQSDSQVYSASPTVLELVIDAPGHILQIVVEPCQFRVRKSPYSRSHGRRYHTRGLDFYRLFMLRSNLGVYEGVLYSVPLPNKAVEQEDALEDLAWSKVYRKGHKTARHIQEMDDWLQPEGIEPMDLPESKLLAQIPAFPDFKDITFAQRMVDHGFLYNVMVHPQPIRDTDRGELNVSTLLDRIKRTLDNPDELVHSGSPTL